MGVTSKETKNGQQNQPKARNKIPRMHKHSK
jgi:hypothetical protein